MSGGDSQDQAALLPTVAGTCWVQSHHSPDICVWVVCSLPLAYDNGFVVVVISTEWFGFIRMQLQMSKGVELGMQKMRVLV